MPGGSPFDGTFGITNPRVLANSTKVSVGGVTATTAQLPPGAYLLTSDVNCFVRQGAAAVAATTSGNPLWAFAYLPIFVSGESDDYVAGITTGAAGTLYAIGL